MTLREIGNVEIVKKTTNDDGSINLECSHKPEDKDWRAYSKVCWLPNKPELIVKYKINLTNLIFSVKLLGLNLNL